MSAFQKVPKLYLQSHSLCQKSKYYWLKKIDFRRPFFVSMIFFNFNFWAILFSKIMPNFLIIIHCMYFQNTMVSFEWKMVYPFSMYWIWKTFIFQIFKIQPLMPLTNLKSTCLWHDNTFTRILATLVISVVQGKSLQSLDYCQCILAGKKYSKILVFLLY